MRWIALEMAGQDPGPVLGNPPKSSDKELAQERLDQIGTSPTIPLRDMMDMREDGVGGYKVFHHQDGYMGRIVKFLDWLQAIPLQGNSRVFSLSDTDAALAFLRVASMQPRKKKR